MAAAPQTIHIPAGAPINEAVRPEWLEFGKASLTNENVRQNKRNDLEKRYGFASALATTRLDATTGSVAYKLFADGDQILRITYNAGLYQLEGWDAISSRWIPRRGYLPECTFKSIELPGVGASSFLCDCAATTNGYVGTTWLSSTSTGLYTFASVINPNTGIIVSAPVQVGTLSSSSVDQDPLIVAVGTYLIVLRRETGTGNIKAWYLNTATAASITTGWVAMTNPVTDLGSPNRMAVCSLPHASDPKAAVIYTNNTGGTDRVSLVVFDETGVLDSATIATASTTASNVDVIGNTSGTLWAAWNQGTAVKVAGYDPANLASITSTAATVITVATSANTIGLVNSSATGEGKVIVSEGSAPYMVYHRAWTTSAGAVTPAGSTVSVYGLNALASPFVYDGRYYVVAYSVPVFIGAGTIATIDQVLVDWTDATTSFRPIANPYPGISSNPYTVKRHACTIGTKVYHPWPIARSSGGAGGVLVELDFTSTQRWLGTRVGSTLRFCGGVTYNDDGARVAEEGFLFPPPKPTGTVAGTGITGDYRYVAVYEEVDAEGNWHQSGLSVPSAVITAADDTITVSTYPLAVSGRINTTSAQSSALRVAFYRTAAGGEAPYYRLTTVANTNTALVTYDDATTDATLIANAKLYSQPGVVGTAQDHRAPPGFLHIVDHLGLVVGMSEREIWCSGQPVYGEGTWYSPILTQPFNGGTALASQDGLIYAFTRRSVYALPCEVPSDNASQGGLGAPQLLAADVGCIDPRSVVVTALGVFFQSERGIELLTRGRNVEWIGESVQTTLSSYPVIVAARLDSLDSLVYFECVASESSGQVSGNGRTLVYDLTLQAWVSADRRKNSAGTADSPAQDACVVYSGSAYRYAWMGTDGKVYIQDRTTYLDAGSFVTAKWETVDVKFGLQQQQLVNGAMLLATRNSAAGLKIEVAVDGAAYSSANDKIWLEAVTSGKSQYEFRPPLTAKQRMRFRVTDTVPATLGTGQGFTWIGLSVDVTPKTGPTKATPHIETTGRR